MTFGGFWWVNSGLRVLTLWENGLRFYEKSSRASWRAGPRAWVGFCFWVETLSMIPLLEWKGCGSVCGDLICFVLFWNVRSDEMVSPLRRGLGPFCFWDAMNYVCLFVLGHSVCLNQVMFLLVFGILCMVILFRACLVWTEWIIHACAVFECFQHTVHCFVQHMLL